jgi:hypothetical protein
VDALVEEVGRLRHAHHQARLAQPAVSVYTTQLEIDNRNQCCGSGMFIPDPGSELFPSWIRI